MDSDEEYDRRRRRDKFRGERRDYTDRGGRERDDRRRDDWQDRRGQMGTQMRNRNNRGGFRNDWNRREFQDYDRGRQERYSPPSRRTDMSPPQKRQRRDWEGGYGGYDGGHGNQGGHGYWMGGRGRQYQGQTHGSHDGESGGRSEGTTGTGQMLSFKQFLAKQEDSIDDQEAVKKYNEYKMEFHKAQLSEFFLAHKDEEWFRTKYYPDECDRQQLETEEAIDHRLRVFLEFLKKGDMEKVELQADKSESITRLLDSVVIRLEGGSDLDLTILDQPELMQSYERPRTVSESQQRPTKPEDKPRDDKKEEGEESEEKDAEKKEKEEGGEEGEKKENGEEKTGEEETPIPPPPTDDDGKVLPEPIPPPPAEDGDKKDEEEGETDKEPARKKKRGKKRKRPRDQEYSDSESDISSSSDSGSESEESEHEQGALEPEPAPPGLESGGDKGASESDNKLEEGEAKEDGEEEEEEEEKEEGEKEEGEKEPDEPKPRALHKTFSIFIRNVSPIIKKEEIVALCKRYKGFLRVALAEPQPDRSYQRHGWVTFDRTVNIKEICWDLSSIRLRDCELSPVVNRDLAHRIRAVSGITAHKGIVKADLKLAARLVQVMDQKHGLFTGECGWDTKKEKEREEKKKKEKEEKEKKKEEAAATAGAGEGEKEGEKKAEKAEEGSIEDKEEQPIPAEPKELLPARNPVLENITDYLVEELSAEEELLLGMRVDGLEEGQEMGEGDVTFEKDEHLCKVLDRLLLYLRIVHSLDYYNASKYQYNFEDEMPNRCGIMHCRGQNPPTRMTQKDVEAWKSNFENRLMPLINIKNSMTDEELIKLGKKDQELEVEKFVKANTKELAKDKWLCPLSGKKFKGPEFVRKHIFNKHGDKIDAVKKEVLFFNNFLQDSGKQKLMEASKPKPAPAASNEREGGDQGYNGQRGVSYNRGYQQQGSYEGQRERPQALYTQNRGYGQSGRGGYDQSYGNNYQGQQQRQFQRRSDPRSIIQYRDLDAPDDSDFF